MGLAAGLAVVAARAWGAVPLPLWSCPYRHLTGLPCPTCYLSRSVLASFRGDLVGAMRWHALGPPLVATGLWLLWQQLARGVSPDSPRARQWAVMLGVGALGYWVLRLLVPALRP